jgi:hypothetical protein
MNDSEKLEKLIDFILLKTQEVKEEKFIEEKSDLVAAASLEAQLLLASHLAICEAQAKQAKTDYEFLRSQSAITIKNGSTGKITDAMLEHHLNVDEEVKKAKLLVAESEGTSKKWNYIFNTLKDAHIFFRNLNKKQI